MLTTILISFAAFCVGFILSGFMAGAKKVNKTPFERFREADDDIDIKTLSDEEAKQWYNIVLNDYLDGTDELRKRGI